MTIDENQEALLAEYNSLKAEIITITNRNTQVMSLTSAGIIIATGVAFSQKEPLINLCSVALSYWAWSEQIAMRSSYARIGAYIHSFLEPRLNLIWEGVVIDLEDQSITEINIKNSVLRVFKAAQEKYSLAMIFSFIMLLVSFRVFPTYNKEISDIREIVLLFSFWLFSWRIIRSIQSRYYRQNWKKTFKKLLEK